MYTDLKDTSDSDMPHTVKGIHSYMAINSRILS